MFRLAWAVGVVGLLASGQFIFRVPQSGVTCDATVSSTANIEAQLSVSTGSTRTVCITSGTYTSVDLDNVSRTAMVTFTAASGASVTLEGSVDNTDYATIDGTAGGGTMTLRSFSAGNCSTHVQIKNVTFQPNYPGLDLSNVSACGVDQAILIDNVTMDNVYISSTQQGHIQISNGRGITISNTSVQGCPTDGGVAFSECGDAIQITGTSQDITIGPGNVLHILESECNATGGAHCDCMQYFGNLGTGILVQGNWFKNCSFLILNESFPTSATYRNNIFTDIFSLQVDQHVSGVWEHNTMYNATDVYLCTDGSDVWSSVKSNILINSAFSNRSDCLENANWTHQLCNDASSCTNAGTSPQQATPTFVGGSPGSITTCAGWQLASGSAGENNGHDGNDKGTNYYGPCKGA